jgi:hypothetical protein
VASLRWPKPPLGPIRVAGHPLFIFFFFKKKKKERKKELAWGHYGEKKVIMVELKKFKTFGRCIAKIETLKLELKIASNFRDKV